MAAAAIVLALVAGIGVYMYASGADKRAQENASLVDAYVANADIAKGTTGAEITQAGLITQEKVAKDSVPPGAVTDLNDLADLQTAGPISSKQFITVRLVRVGEGRRRRCVLQLDRGEQPRRGDGHGRRRPRRRQPDLSR